MEQKELYKILPNQEGFIFTNPKVHYLRGLIRGVIYGLPLHETPQKHALEIQKALNREWKTDKLFANLFKMYPEYSFKAWHHEKTDQIYISFKEH